MDQVPGLQLDCFPFSWAGWRIGSIIYLLKNAKKIDWLNLYHAGQRTLCFSWIYKTLNSDGKIYLKLDMDLRGCDLAVNIGALRKKSHKSHLGLRPSLLSPKRKSQNLFPVTIS